MSEKWQIDLMSFSQPLPPKTTLKSQWIFFLMYEHTRTKKEKRRGDQNTEENSSNSYKPEETGG